MIFEAMRRCMRYVLCTRDKGLLINPTQKWDGSNKHEFCLRGRSDSDYAKDIQTRQSVTGYVVYLGCVSTMHRNATQKTVALSSCEAELNVAVLCAQNMMYQKITLESIGLKVELPMVLDMDNKEAIDLINSFSVGGCMRHSDVKQCFLHVLKAAKVLIVK